MSIVVVDYCKGNLRSVKRGLERAGCAVEISADPRTIMRGDAIVLPGVGSFHDAADFMTSSGQMQAIRERIAQGVPFLGICLGMQLLLSRGCEGVSAGAGSTGDGWDAGLGTIEGEAVLMDDVREDGTRVKIPHVGWNDVRYTRESSLFEGVPDGSFFYFTHSYIARPESEDATIGTTEHGTVFCSALQRGNVFGVQFHPEKSSARGQRVLENFVRIAYGA